MTNAQCPDNGDGYTRFPCVAQVSHNGAFNYKLLVTNKGNEALTNYILYDVLPVKGDTGVGQPVSTLQRGSQWQPVLTGAITAADAYTTSAGAVIEYSSAANPCRPEVSSTATESPADHWQSGCTDDWTASPADFSKVTAFRITAAFAAAPYWQPLKALTFNVPMLAPENAPPSIVGSSKYFSPAWNSLAHRVTQQSNSQRLDTAEPRQVGIIVPTMKYRLGNLVWKDDNNNGIADSGEAGIKDVDVNLIDSSNKVVASTKTDADGHYAFDGLAAGKYRVAIPTPTAQTALAGLNSSSTGEEASPDTNGDNNDNGVTVDGTLGLVSGEITLDEVPAEPENEILRSDSSDDDNDVWPDIASNVTVDFGIVPPATSAKDADADDLSDEDEINVGTDPYNPDTDGDGINDKTEVGVNPATPIDTDQDGKPNALDVEDDNDGILTKNENYNGGTPLDDDSDGDKIPDYLDTDDDGDGKLSATESNDPNKDGSLADAVDTDGDGKPDYLDLNDTDGPKADTDGDALTNVEEVALGTNPTKADTDGDGLTDGAEVNTTKTDPLKADTDGDGVNDFDEANQPLLKDPNVLACIRTTLKLGADQQPTAAQLADSLAWIARLTSLSAMPGCRSWAS